MSESDEPAGSWFQASGLVDRSRVRLAVYGESLEPAEVSALLQCEPTEAWRRGDVLRRRPVRQGAWFLEVYGEEPIGPEELLDRLLTQLPQDPRVWATLCARYKVAWRITMQIAVISRGFELSADMQRRLAPLGVPLGFDFYPLDDGVGDDEE